MGSLMPIGRPKTARAVTEKKKGSERIVSTLFRYRLFSAYISSQAVSRRFGRLTVVRPSLETLSVIPAAE